MRTQTSQKAEPFACAPMKIILGVFAIFLCAVIFLAATVHHTSAAALSTVNFQARLESSTGAIAPDGNYNIRFKLYSASTGGSALWTETYQNSASQGIQVVNGYVTVNLGAVTSFPGTINWDQDLYLTMDIGGTSVGGSPTYDGEMTPRIKITAVPYAFRAGQLSKLTGANTSILDFDTQTAARTVLLPDESGTICIQNSANCGFLTGAAASGSYVQLQATTPGTAQTGNFNISGSGIAALLQAANINATTAYKLNGTSGATTTCSSGDVLQNAVIQGGIITAGTCIASGGGGIASLTLAGTSGSSQTITNGDTITLGAGTNISTTGVATDTVTIAVVNAPTFSGVITSTVTTGTAPFTIASTTKVTNLNADTLDSIDSTGFAAASGSASYIQNQNVGAQTTANFWIDGTGKVNLLNSVTGYQYNGTSGSTTTCSGGNVLQNAVVQGGIITGGTCVANGGGTSVTLQGSTPGTADVGNFNVTGTGIAAILQGSTSVKTPLLDTISAGTLNIGTTNATQINLNKNVVVASGQYISLIGGITSTRPASPTEGMLYYDTTTTSLLVYANGKWQTDRTSSTKIVAPSNASQAQKDSADYVATGSADQTIINTALTAAAGGKVLLLEGTFTTSDAISIPNNTTLAGNGRGTLIQFSNIATQNKNMITNTDTTTGEGVVVRDLRLDGNNTVNTSGTQRGVYFNGVGFGTTGAASIRQGASVLNIWANYFRETGIYLDLSTNGTVANNSAFSNIGDGIYIKASNRDTVTNNIVVNNSGFGVHVGGSIAITVSSNTIGGNGLLSGTNTGGGILFDGTSSNNAIANNALQNNGTGSGAANSSIYIVSASNNTITGNSIADSAGTGYGIDIFDSASTSNYFADNSLSGTGATNIQDNGTTTVFAGQVNGSGNYMVQPAGTVELMKNTNVTGTISGTSSLTLGTSSSVNGTIVLKNSTNANIVTLQSAAQTGNFTLSTPVLTANSTILTDLTGVQLQSSTPGTAQTGNFNISGTGIAGTLQAANINATTAFKLNGTTGSSTTCSSGNVLQNAVIQGGIITGGTCVANGGGVAPTLQDVYTNSNTTPFITLSAVGGGVFIRDASSTVGGNLFAVQNNAGGTSYLAVTTSGTSVAGTFTASGALTVSSGGASINGGLNNNTSGITNAGAVSGVTTLAASGTGTFSATGGNALAVNGAPTNSATSSLFQLGNAIASGNTAANGGTYFGLNAPASGAGSAADFLNFQTNGTYKLKVTSAGLLDAVGGFAVNGVSGASVSACSGGQVLTNIGVTNGIITSLGSCATNGAGSTPTLQNVYNNSSTTPYITLNATGNGLFVRDASSTVGGNLFAIQNNAGSTSYLAVTTSGASIAGTFTSSGALTVSSGGASISGGLNNNTGGITNAGAVSGVTTLGASGVGTFSATGGNALAVTGAPTNSATSSLVQLGNAIASGNTAANGGTYLGLNAPASGAGSAADFLNFQTNGTYKLKVTSAGVLDAVGGFAVNGAAGSSVTACSGGQVLTNIGVTNGIITSVGSCAANGGGIAPTLQDAYTNSGASPYITLSATGHGLFIRDASSTVGGNLFAIQNNAGSTSYLAVTTSGASVAGTFTSSGALVVSSGGASITGGINNNTGGVTNAGAVSGVTTLGASGIGTFSATGGNALAVTGAPTNSATSSLLQFGSPIAGGNSAANGGTYLGLNAPSSGAGSAADFLNFQTNGTYKLKVTSAGLLDAVGGFAVNGVAGASVAACSGGQVLTNIGVTNGIITSLGTCATNGGGVTPSLQDVYDNSSSPASVLLANSKNFVITAADTATDPSILFNLQCVTSCGSNGRFSVQNAGTDYLTVNPNSTLVIGSATNNITFSSNGSFVFNGTSRRSKTINLYAEYPNAVLDAGTGSNNSGTMTSGIDLTNRMNYYKWTTTQATNQSYDIDLQIPIPSDFDSWDSNPLAITTYTSNTTNGTITLEARDTGGTVRCNFVSVTPGSTSTWTANNTACTLSAGTYTAGGYMTLRIRVQSPTSGDVRAGNIVLSYLSKY